MTITEILESYNLIKVNEQISTGECFFTLYEKKFLLIAPNETDLSLEPQVFLYNDMLLDFPHITLQSIPLEMDLPKGTYRWVCLAERNSKVNTIISYEDKIINCIDRLIQLLSMSSLEQEKEFQREFMYYWNSEAIESKMYAVFLTDDKCFAKMDVFFGKSEIRLVQEGLFLNDLGAATSKKKNRKKWERHRENEVFYIPITDNRGILPPHRGFQWTKEEVENIIYGKEIDHISDNTFSSIKKTIPERKDIILVFGMKTTQSTNVFALKVKCKNGKGRTLFDKLHSDIISVEQLPTVRKDYTFLCEQIGNDMGLLNKRILLIGAGSLGSYVAFELLKNGTKYLKIYDGDCLLEENVLRWAFGGALVGLNKAIALQFILKSLHPEICLEGCAKNIQTDVLLEETRDKDLIIFTIGNSDEQLKMNNILKKGKCEIPAIFVWLEEGGINSHILFTDYSKSGCFECLYTNSEGKLVNNRARKNSAEMSEANLIRNGCGGTRAAYGTTILLRTTAVLLDVIRDYYDQKITTNMLIDVYPEKVVISDTKFPIKECSCCGSPAE